MKKIILIIVVIFAFIFTLFIASFIAAKSFLTPERIKNFAEGIIEKSLNAEAEIQEVKPEIGFFKAGIKAEDIEITKNKKKLVSVKEIEFKLKILPLIFKRSLDIQKIYIKEPEIEYHIKKKGKKRKREKAKELKPEAGLLFTLKNFTLEDARIKIYKDKKKIYDIKDFDITFSSYSITKNKINFKGRGGVLIKEPKFINQKINFSFDFDLDIARDFIELKDYSLAVRDIEIEGNGEFEKIIKGEPEYSIKIISKNIELSSLREFLKNKKTNLKGKVDIDLKIKGNIKETLPKIYGKIKSDDITLITEGKRINFNKLRIDFKGVSGELKTKMVYGLQKGNISSRFYMDKLSFKGKLDIEGNLKEFTGKDAVYSLNLNFNGNIKGDINAKGDLESGKNRLTFNISGKKERNIFYLNGSVNSDYFNVNDFLPPEKKNGQKKGKKVELLLPKGVNVHITGNIKRLILKKDKMERVRFRLKVDKKGIRLEDLKGNVYKGRIEGEVYIFKGSIKVKSKIKGKNLEFSEILKIHKFLPGEIKGKLDIRTDASFDLENIFETLNAKNSVFVFKGEWRANPVLTKIADLLKINDLKRLKFQKINARLEINRGWMNLNNFKIQGRNFLIVTTGRVSLKGNLDIKLKINFKGNLGEKLRRFSSLSKYFQNKKGDFELVFDIDGTYKNPKIKLDITDFQRKIQKEIKKKVKKKIKEEIKKGIEELFKRFGF